jgi:hypothetical protein
MNKDENMNITLNQYVDFCERLGSDPEPHLRVGQRFLNMFFSNVSDPELYYETDDSTCHELILHRYVIT